MKKNGFEFDYFYDWDTSQTIYDLNCFNNNKDNINDKNNEKFVDINNEKIGNDNSDEENNLDLPLDKIYYRKKNRKKKRNKSQDKSTADGVEDENESENNSIGKSFIQNHNGCCTII